MFKLTCLPAGPGDSLVVEYGPRGRVRRLLVDAGPRFTWPVVGHLLRGRRGEFYDLLIVTHIDEDHVGGAVALLDDPELRVRLGGVWFNGYAHCKTGGNVLGPVHAEQLTKRIFDSRLPWNDGWRQPVTRGLGGPVVVPDRGGLPVVTLAEGARLVLLGPIGTQLTGLVPGWEQVVKKAGIVPGEGSDGTGRAVPRRLGRWAALSDPLDASALAALAAVVKTDASLPNASSIAFVLEFDGRRLLLTGDAHGEPLAAGVARYGELVGEERPRFDLVKLPHHGSAANVTAELAASWTADRFVVSSDGSGYDHPDDGAIARLLLAADGRPITVYGNHGGGGLARWAERASGLPLTIEAPKTTAAGITVKV